MSALPARMRVIHDGSPSLFQQVAAQMAAGSPHIDHSSIALIQTAHTRRGVFIVDENHKLVGGSVWHEYENTSVGVYYFTKPQERGSGLGLQLTMLAALRSQKMITDNPNHIITFRAVPTMSVKYHNEMGTRVGRHRFYYTVSLQQAGEVFAAQSGLGRVKLVSQLDEQEFSRMLAFDHAVTGRDRSRMLRAHWAFPFTEGAVLFSPYNTVLAVAGVCTTGPAGSPMYKLGPVYASSLQHASSCVRPVLDWARLRGDGKLLIGTVTESKGFSLLDPLLRQYNVPELRVTHSFSGGEFVERADSHMILVPHDNTAHIDI